MPNDTQRMDWLCSMHIQVREPRAYGSGPVLIYAKADWEETQSDLREQIDKQMRPPATTPEGTT